jgi:unsaturated rhamnogalacturonyl hydrolase
MKNRISLKRAFNMVILLSCITISGLSQKVVLLDNFYNNETSSKTGKPFHYLWEDTEMSGYSQFGELLQQKGFKLSTLREKPNLTNLKEALIYIIVDPDTPLEAAHPNNMDSKAASTIANWVKAGGILLMFTNDYKNAELDSFNILASKFGMKYTNLLLHPEKSEPDKPRCFNSCASINLPNHPLFKGVSKIFLKEISSIICENPAKPILVEAGQAIMAEAKYGKGYVFAVGDPWLYNEYIDHLMLPDDFENLKAARNLVDLLVMKINKNTFHQN